VCRFSTGNLRRFLSDVDQLDIGGQFLPGEGVIGVEENHISRRGNHAHEGRRAAFPAHPKLLPGIGIDMRRESLAFHGEQEIGAVLAMRALDRNPAAANLARTEAPNELLQAAHDLMASNGELQGLPPSGRFDRRAVLEANGEVDPHSIAYLC
jgi:hypothetical protein